MSSTATASNATAPTQILQVSGHSYAYRRFGNGSGLPLLCLQHFTGTLDNWDPAVSDPLASRREVILFDNAGIGRSSGEVPDSRNGHARHGFSRRARSGGVRRLRFLPRRHDRATNREGPSFDLSADDPRR